MIVNDKKTGQRLKICVPSSMPVTLWGTYRGLIRSLNKEYAEVALVSLDIPESYQLIKIRAKVIERIRQTHESLLAKQTDRMGV